MQNELTLLCLKHVIMINQVCRTSGASEAAELRGLRIDLAVSPVTFEMSGSVIMVFMSQSVLKK